MERKKTDKREKSQEIFEQSDSERVLQDCREICKQTTVREETMFMRDSAIWAASRTMPLCFRLILSYTDPQLIIQGMNCNLKLSYGIN
uniref:Uncharacterized protein n=1 Tax=Sphaerodactylus townsendi TaxID=933632 RepID=A0ACB8EXU4_9SAUR